MKILRDSYKNRIILKLIGNFDMYSKDDFIKTIESIKSHYNSLIIDFKQTTYIDSSGLGLLIKYIYDNDQFNIEFINISNNLIEIFKLSQIYDHMKIYDSYEEIK